MGVAVKYIDYSPGGSGHAAYFDYLERVRAQMPPAAYAFAVREEHHTLNHPNSLHDAWLETVEDSGDRVRLGFLGQRHDRRIFLTYLGVQCHTLGEAALAVQEAANPIRRDDLIHHELRMMDDGSLCHEIAFASGRSVEVVFRDLEHTVELKLQS